MQRPGARVRVPLGSFGGARSPLSPPTEVTLLDVTLEAGAELEIEVPEGHRAFFVPINGRAELDGVGFGLDDLDAAFLPLSTVPTTHRLAAKGAAKVAVFIGEPPRQPLVSNGPMAFASQQDLIAATAAYQRGDMGRL